MRRGEILRLRWDDLNGTDRVIKIRERKHPRERDRIDECPLLPAHPVWPRPDALKIAKAQPRRTELIFPYLPDTIGERFEHACAAAERDGIVFHLLLHESLSRYAERGFDPLRLQLVGGHRDLGHVATYAKLTARRLASFLADSLDMLGDALVYGFSLFVLARSVRWQAGAALAKGGFMLAFGLAVLGEAAYKVFHPVMPGVATMGIVGTIALAANLVCFSLLYRHRADNLNMSSTWLCSRNDLIANVGVLVPAGAAHLLASRWPDIVIGCIIAVPFLRSSFSDLRDAARALWPASYAT